MSLPEGEAVRLLARAAALAAGSALDTLPNPSVGCVLAGPGGEVAGEGFHRGYGLPHAEAEALAAAGERARGATALVTVEPCAGGVPGKRTPGCAEALRAAGVAAVVYACDDASPHAGGRGPALLREGGIEVRRVPCAAAAALLRRYEPARDAPFPWTVAKWAMTLDGKTADARGASRWITGEEARERVHEMRRRVDAVVVGARTAALDDPDLRPRGGGSPRGPIPLRVVVDTSLRLSTASRMVASAREGPVLVATGGRAREERRRALRDAGVSVEDFPGVLGRVDLAALFRSLRERGARRVLLEGGGEITAAALRAGLVRQVAAFAAPTILGGQGAPTPVGGPEGLRTAADPIRLEEVRVTRVGGDVLIEGFVAS